MEVLSDEDLKNYLNLEVKRNKSIRYIIVLAVCFFIYVLISGKYEFGANIMKSFCIALAISCGFQYLYYEKMLNKIENETIKNKVKKLDIYLLVSGAIAFLTSFSDLIWNDYFFIRLVLLETAVIISCIIIICYVKKVTLVLKKL